MKYSYPKNISEFRNNDEYEIKNYKATSIQDWSKPFTYVYAMCIDKKNYIKYLIVNNRIRIIKNE